jgi:phage shock protein PspC (stress-responsive transcriptional regulator)
MNLEQFTLDTKNDMIAGVCAGLANYFMIDVTLVRVAFVMLTVLSGWTIILYILLAIVAPNDYEVK